jgi:1-deoxy-D-xylulose-5-phosphate synthase
MIATAAAIDDRPSAVRYPRSDGTGVPSPEIGIPLAIGKCRVVREGTSVALLSLGGRLQECCRAADELAAYGFSNTVADARFAKPLDVDPRLAARTPPRPIEGGSIGGFGAIVQTLTEHGELDQGLIFAA